MTIKIIITENYESMSQVAAQIVKEKIIQTLKNQKECVLGLATGNSPTGLYKNLAKMANAGEFDCKLIRSFNLDEYIGLPGENCQQRTIHPESYSYFMIQEFFSLLENKFIETSIRQKVQEEYTRKIENVGGIDLQIIGVGGRGHVAFHESGIPFEDSNVLLVKLEDNTVSNAVLDGHFPSVKDSPRYAVSMGAELVYKAKTVILLANGERKVGAVAESLLSDPTPDVPISYGQIYSQRGGELIYVLDKIAGRELLAKKETLEQKGMKIETFN